MPPSSCLRQDLILTGAKSPQWTLFFLSIASHCQGQTDGSGCKTSGQNCMHVRETYWTIAQNWRLKVGWWYKVLEALLSCHHRG